jgi:uncharacterized membrane protein
MRFFFNSFFFWFALGINYHQASVKDIVIVETIEIYLNQHDKQRKDGTMRSLSFFFGFSLTRINSHQTSVKGIVIVETIEISITA